MLDHCLKPTFARLPVRCQGPQAFVGLNARGFTLIEILVAISLMAVLTLMCWRGLDSVIRARDRILATGEAMQSLTTAMAQLDEDLRRAQILRLILNRDPVSTVRSPQGAVLVIDRPLSGLAKGMTQHVEWRINERRLERGFSAPENPVEPVSARVLKWQTLLEPVDGWTIRLLRKNLRRQWLDAQAEVVGGVSATNEIAALEFSLVQAEQTLTRVLVVED